MSNRDPTMAEAALTSRMAQPYLQSAGMDMQPSTTSNQNITAGNFPIPTSVHHRPPTPSQYHRQDSGLSFFYLKKGEKGGRLALFLIKCLLSYDREMYYPLIRQKGNFTMYELFVPKICMSFNYMIHHMKYFLTIFIGIFNQVKLEYSLFEIDFLLKNILLFRTFILYIPQTLFNFENIFFFNFENNYYFKILHILYYINEL